MLHVSFLELEAGLPEIRRSPANCGSVELIVRRPAVGEREILVEAVLSPLTGLTGDTWHVRPSIRIPDRSPHPEMQLNVMNSRSAALIAGSARPGDNGGGYGGGGYGDTGHVNIAGPAVIDRRALAGDQLYLDLDLSEDNLPPGSQLQLGTAVIEVTAQPHLGCAKFSSRFGPDALRFVNSPTGRRLRLRGLNARVLTTGTVRRGDQAIKVRPLLDEAGGQRSS